MPRAANGPALRLRPTRDQAAQPALPGSRVEMATGTYPSGIGHPYTYPLELSFTRRITRTRTRVGKCFHTRTRRVIYTRELHINITYSYEK